MDTICVLFLLSSPLRSSFVSVVLFFNASLNDVAPVFLMIFSVDFVTMEKCVLLIGAICVLFLLSSPPRFS